MDEESHSHNMAKRIKVSSKSKQKGKREFKMYKSGEVSKPGIDRHMEKLPIEILTYIFTFLQRSDVIRAATVCRSWRNLIFNSPELWRKSFLKLRCNRNSIASRNAIKFCKRFGRFIRQLDIKCDHPSKNHRCEYMLGHFLRVLRHLRTNRLKSFKVSKLQISRGRHLQTIRSTGDALSRVMLSQNNLKTFHMANSHWPPEVGKAILQSVTGKFSKCLRSLKLEEFFSPGVFPKSSFRQQRILSREMSCLSRLKHLSISYHYLSDDILKQLADTSRHRLTRLELVASNVTPSSNFISSGTWKILTKSCPNLKIDFKICGRVHSPSVAIPAILDPAMQVSRLNLNIGSSFTLNAQRYLDLRGILRFITSNFRTKLTRFLMNIDNHRDSIDRPLIRMVKKCENLTSVKVWAHFSNYETTRAVVKSTIKDRKKKKKMADTSSPVNKTQQQQPSEGDIERGGRIPHKTTVTSTTTTIPTTSTIISATNTDGIDSDGGEYSGGMSSSSIIYNGEGTRSSSSRSGSVDRNIG